MYYLPAEANDIVPDISDLSAQCSAFFKDEKEQYRCRKKTPRTKKTANTQKAKYAIKTRYIRSLQLDIGWVGESTETAAIQVCLFNPDYHYAGNVINAVQKKINQFT